ncbi:MAG: PPC domain-containing protein, partial [Pseudomonadota bacterium]
GDADLYVRFGSPPTTSSYDCRPWLNGNNETCDISNVQAGTYHVMVRAYSTFSGVSLTASFDEPSGGGGAEGGSGSASNLSASRRNWLRYTIDIPPGMSTLTVQISGGSGDADLYLRYGSQPSTSQYDCRPYLNGNNETCTITNPQPGTWHIGLRAYQTFSGVNLSAEWSP